MVWLGLTKTICSKLLLVLFRDFFFRDDSFNALTERLNVDQTINPIVPADVWLSKICSLTVLSKHLANCVTAYFEY